MRTRKAYAGFLNKGTAFYLSVFFCAVLVRIRYLWVTGPLVRQHDIYDNGHLDYIMHVFHTLTLPESNLNELCQPPLHYFLTALVMRAGASFGAEITEESKWLQAFPFALSILLLPVLYLVIQETEIPDMAKRTASMLVSFCPALIYMSAQINNDQTMIFFGALSILFTLRYVKSHGFRELMFSGVFLGLSMMSKFNGACLALFMAPLMIAVFVTGTRGPKGKKTGRILAEWGAFLLVSGVLGLWYQVRQFVVFSQPFGYAVYPDPESLMYTGHTSRRYRFLGISLKELMNGYCDITNDRNVWTYMFKSSLFGEWSSWNVPAVFKYLLLSAGIVASLWCIAGIFRLIFADRKTGGLTRASVALLSLTQIVFFIYFNLNYPFTCSMDFRYVAFLVLPFAVSFGAMKPYKVSEGLAVVYCICSAVFCLGAS
ncbi:MAG: glycosyltransferase family 39 protein [Lachnospiraceae bacterium]|nr:glycosyltransferase family 39 protein [Lachnospiraceae bacterium]